MKRSIIPLLLLLLFLTCLPTVAAVAEEPSVGFKSYPSKLLSGVDPLSLTLDPTYDEDLYVAEVISAELWGDHGKIASMTWSDLHDATDLGTMASIGEYSVVVKVKFMHTISGDETEKTATANFRIFEYKATVAVSDNAGTSAVSQSGNVYYNDELNIRANPDSHHVFDHWERDGSTVGENDARYDLTAADSGKTITAVFAGSYEVKANHGDNGNVAPKAQGVISGGSLTLTAIPDTGYEVDEWTEGGNTLQTGGNKLTLTNITSDRNITVTFKKIQYPVTARVRGAGGTVSPTSTTVEHGGSITLTASPATGYEVEGWEHPGGTQTGGNTLTISDVTDEQEITVIFKKIQCQIFATVTNAGGTVSPTYESVEHGGSITLTATPDAGYEVDEWGVNTGDKQTGGTTLAISNVTAARNIHVTFKKIQYAVTATAGTGGTVSPTAQTVEHGESLTLTASPDTGYEVDEWTEDGATLQTGGNTLAISNVTAARNIAVTFKKIQYAVTATAGAGGAVSPTSESVEHGDPITLTASPDTGYEVDEWTGDGISPQTGGNELTLTNITAARNITVTFKKIQYTVTATAGAGGTVSPTSDTVMHDGFVTLTATPDKGYLIDQWVEGGVTLQTGGDTLTLNDIKTSRYINVSFRIPAAPKVSLIDVRESAKTPEEGMPVPCEIWVYLEGEGLANVALTRVWQEDGEEKSEIFDLYSLQGEKETVRFFTVYQPGEYFATVQDIFGQSRISKRFVIEIVDGKLDETPNTPNGK